MNGADGSRNRPRTGFAVRRRPPRVSRRVRWALLGGALGVVLGGTGAVFWATRADVFAVTRIESGAYRFTDPEALDRRLGSFLGRNLWTLSTAEVRDRLADLPWVRDLRVVRRLPGTIEVDFREWRPLAVLAPAADAAADGPSLVLGENGRALPFPAGLAPAGLPTLVGVRTLPEGEGPGSDLDPGESAGLLELFSAVADAGLETVSPVDFVVVRPEGFAIVLQGGQGRLLLGREEFAARLDRYMAARDHLEPGLEIDLRFADRVTVRRAGARPATAADTSR
ncbi:MAG: cell division protein FtsQ/DivIB [Candidatus Krumholzibacteriia bacterium]